MTIVAGAAIASFGAMAQVQPASVVPAADDRVTEEDSVAAAVEEDRWGWVGWGHPSHHRRPTLKLHPPNSGATVELPLLDSSPQEGKPNGDSIDDQLTIAIATSKPPTAAVDEMALACAAIEAEAALANERKYIPTDELLESFAVASPLGDDDGDDDFDEWFKGLGVSSLSEAPTSD